MKNVNLIMLISISIVQIIILYYKQIFILTEDLYRLIVGPQLTDRQFNDYLKFVYKWRWVSYLYIWFTLFLRISFTWICLKVGSFISDTFTDTSFWKIAIQAEIVFAVGAVIGLIYTEFFIRVESIEQLSINPFSLQVFVSDSVPKWSSYFFNTLNIFELSYFLFLVYLITQESKSKFLPSLKFVASTYLPGLALWVLLVSYLSVVFQP